jgi:gas vesicle protein
MNLFWFGVLIGAVTMFMSMVIIASQAVDEKNRQIIYLRQQLKEQAERERTVKYENDNN